MGSGASRHGSALSSSHQKENAKNRLNPTEGVENWKQKMLLDIGADPLSVIRDFPRMNLFFVDSEEDQERLIKERQYMNYTTDGTNDVAADGDGDEDGDGDADEVEVDVAVPEKDGNGASRRQSTSTRRSLGQGDKDRHKQRDDGNGRASQCSRPNPLNPGRGINGGRNSATSRRRSSDPTLEPNQRAFAARMRRLKANVLALAELVGEGNTYGQWFKECWEAKERECGSSSPRSVADSSAAHPMEGAGGRHSLNTSSVVFAPDIHQIFQSTCLECGMLTLTADPAEAGLGGETSTRRHSRQPPRGASYPFTPQPSLLFTPSTVAGGNHTSAVAANEGTNGPANASGHQSVIHASAKPEYAVASETFHAMQFIVQGVMFFPFQRLKHILWFPWAPSPLYTDVDWKVFVYVLRNVRSVPEFVYEKRVQHSAHKRAIGAADEYHLSSFQRRPSDSGEDSLAETTPLLPPRGGGHSNPNSCIAAEPGPSGGPYTHAQATHSGAGGKMRRGDMDKALLVIKHLQVVQHFVEESDRKRIPKYRLDWSCTIYADKEAMETTYRPFLPKQRQRWQLRKQHNGKATTMDSVRAKVPSSSGNPEPDHSRGDCGQPSSREDHTPFPGVDITHPTPYEQERAVDVSRNQDEDHSKSKRLSSTSRSHSRGGSGGSSGSVCQTPSLLVSVSEAGAAGSNGTSFVGVRPSQQKELVGKEVVFANIDVVGAQVEALKGGICGVPSAWKRNTSELAFALDAQYRIELQEVAELKTSRY